MRREAWEPGAKASASTKVKRDIESLLSDFINPNQRGIFNKMSLTRTNDVNIERLWQLLRDLGIVIKDGAPKEAGAALASNVAFRWHRSYTSRRI